ncbi:Nramp family divalent metal transporter [Sphingomonas sp. Mn802worker]|uniref:Nramp family divalent metal transporter n=1 Tax=Sphingomonas sp. Mn802worker TaxID=629773 RepID=UPI00036465B5|nr:Nramp family divalent metal transporter [Sphingomonas sp. Mn802worker]
MQQAAGATPHQLDAPKPRKGGALRVLGTGVITGAADDDPSAIGTYASAGAKFGLAFLWIAPVLLPMMFVVTYLSAKLGRVYGKGLFAAVRDRYPRWLLYPLMLGAFTGNVIEAAANMGGVGAALNLLVPVPVPTIVVAVAVGVVLFQLFGSYALLRSIFRWLTLALFAYVAAAILGRPDWSAVLRATVAPQVRFSSDFLAMIVACIGTSLSAYVYTWQSNQEVEEQIDEGKLTARQRRGASRRELARTRRDVMVGMVFANIILYFIILSTATTLHPQGIAQIDSAAQAAQALEPLAGAWAKWLFALGVVGVGFLAIPVMTTGAAYDLVQGLGEKGTLHHRPREAKLFYGVILLVTIVAAGLNFLGFNPMRALVVSGIVQGFSVPPLLLMMMLMTNDRGMMGERRNGALLNIVGWTTTAATFAATACLVVSWIV